MPFFGMYSLRGFKQFLDEEEHKARHLFHENAHEWLALRLGGKPQDRSIQFHGQSRVTIAGLNTWQNHVQVALAGLLGEAKALKNDWNPDCKLDVGGRMEAFGSRLYDQVRHWPADPDSSYGIEPDVPMTCPRASTEWGSLTVADLASSISRGLTKDRVMFGLMEVATIMNDDASWAEFMAYHNDHQA